jgi:hypothetical protein
MVVVEEEVAEEEAVPPIWINLYFKTSAFAGNFLIFFLSFC